MWRRRSYLRSGYPPGVIERSPRSGRSSEHASGFGAVLRVLTVHTVSTSPCCCERANQLDTNTVSYTHLRAHETKANLVCRLLHEKKKNKAREHTCAKVLERSIKSHVYHPFDR